VVVFKYLGRRKTKLKFEVNQMKGTDITCDGIAEALKAIWADALQREEFDVNDNFLDLGGDSLSAMLCISRIREAYNVELTLEDFFLDHATVVGFAKVISDERKLP
jgi:acyl carrier protein